MEEAGEYGFQDQGNRLPFACGGPIYVPDLVSPLTSIADFKASVLQELQGLGADLGSLGDFDEELSVDELKVFTEEELVERALRENFDDVDDGDQTKVMDCSDGRQNNTSCISGNELVGSPDLAFQSRKLRPQVSKEGLPILKCDASRENSNLQKGKKRGRRFDRDSRAAELEGNYLAKVNQLATVKQKQDEDKLAARLHSFCGNSQSLEGTFTTSEKIEKMRSLRFATSPLKVNTRKSQEYKPLYYPEVILCVEIYHRKNNSVKTQEFLVFGSQILTELRDNIYCLMDRLMETAGQHDPSGYFLIEDTFYNDLRNQSSIDYSKPMLDWLKNCKSEAEEKWEVIMSGVLKKKQKELLGDLEISKIPNFKVAEMHKTRFSDLRFRLGAGYLYCHQGNCKHMLVIRDMRLIHPEDVQNEADYPLLTFQLRPRYRKCSVCKIYHATKMTVDDVWAPKNPCYFCIKCYFLLHYKEDNSLLYPHSVFDYYHD